MADLDDPPPGPTPDTDRERPPRATPLVLGVLGGIASGKSAVARLLAGADGVVVDADRLAHEVLASPELAELVRERFGDGALDAEGRPDRAWLAQRVFSGPDGEENRRLLEGWIHPRVRARILERLDEARAAGSRVVVLDVPLLLENDAQHGLAGRCDRLIFVDVPRPVRVERAARTRGWSEADLSRRESAQLDLDEKRRRADHVIHNQGTQHELERAVGALLDELLRP